MPPAFDPEDVLVRFYQVEVARFCPSSTHGLHGVHAEFPRVEYGDGFYLRGSSGTLPRGIKEGYPAESVVFSEPTRKVPHLGTQPFCLYWSYPVHPFCTWSHPVLGPCTIRLSECFLSSIDVLTCCATYTADCCV